MWKTKHSRTANTAIHACLLLAKYTLPYLVGKGASSLIINFKQVDCMFLTCHLRVSD